MPILVAEDNRKISKFIKAGLEAESFEVDIAFDGEQAFRKLLAGSYRLAILDLVLPEKDGISVVKDLRARKNRTPILMITARDAVDDIVAGFESGSDGYLTKPFAFAELLARARAIIRRSEHQRGAVVRCAELRLDPVTRKVWCKGTEIDLTSREFDLLEFFMRNPNQVLARNLISENVWGKQFEKFTNIIDVYVNYLRNKLEGRSAKQHIQTVRKHGYMFME